MSTTAPSGPLVQGARQPLLYKQLACYITQFQLSLHTVVVYLQQICYGVRVHGYYFTVVCFVYCCYYFTVAAFLALLI